MEKQVTCIEPSQEMLFLGASLLGLHPVCQRAEEWAEADGGNGEFDQILIKYAIHHFDRKRLPETFEGLR